jgi:hypothetical protein
MSEYKVNGKVLTVTPASFAQAIELKNAVLRALTGQKLSVGDSVIGAFQSGKEVTGEMLDGLLQAVLSIAGNTEVEKLLMKCAEKAVIGEMKEKVNADYFEVETNRPDYFPVLFYLLKENLEPFFSSVFSLLPGLEKAKTAKSQK